MSFYDATYHDDKGRQVGTEMFEASSPQEAHDIAKRRAPENSYNYTLTMGETGTLKPLPKTKQFTRVNFALYFPLGTTLEDAYNQFRENTDHWGDCGELLFAVAESSAIVTGPADTENYGSKEFHDAVKLRR